MLVLSAYVLSCCLRIGFVCLCVKLFFTYWFRLLMCEVVVYLLVSSAYVLSCCLRIGFVCLCVKLLFTC